MPSLLTDLENLGSDEWRQFGPQDEAAARMIEKYIFEHPRYGSLARSRTDEIIEIVRPAVLRARGHKTVASLAPLVKSFVAATRPLVKAATNFKSKLALLDEDTVTLWDAFLERRTGIGIFATMLLRSCQCLPF